MSSLIRQNTEAAFVLSSVMEFLHVWRSGEESSLSLQCKEGKALLNLQVSLGSPDKSHFRHDKPRHGQPRKKSERRKQKENARAAAYRAAKATPAVPAGPPAPPADLPHVSTSPVRLANSPSPHSRLSPARIPPQRSSQNRAREGRYGSRQTWTALWQDRGRLSLSHQSTNSIISTFLSLQETRERSPTSRLSEIF